jgi:hypothetical protein
VNKDQAIAMWRASTEERKAVSDQIKTLIERREALSKVIDGLRTLYPELANAQTDENRNRLHAAIEAGAANLARLPTSVPKGSAAASVILYENPENWYEVADITHELSNRGWLPASDNPDAAVRSALERLVAGEDIRFQRSRNDAGRVVYAYLPDATSRSAEP